MQVQDIMTSKPTCCGPEDSIQDVAKAMTGNSIGAIPVIDDDGRPVGIVTDRDICCRAVAEGKGADTKVSDVMSEDVVTTSPHEDLDSCCNRMEKTQIRRAVVTDSEGKCCGMVAQADIARRADGSETAELVQEISKPSGRSGCC
jgi:CBS domain-containing protein